MNGIGKWISVQHISLDPNHYNPLNCTVFFLNFFFFFYSAVDNPGRVCWPDFKLVTVCDRPSTTFMHANVRWVNSKLVCQADNDPSTTRIERSQIFGGFKGSSRIPPGNPDQWGVIKYLANSLMIATYFLCLFVPTLLILIRNKWKHISEDLGCSISSSFVYSFLYAVDLLGGLDET